MLPCSLTSRDVKAKTLASLQDNAKDPRKFWRVLKQITSEKKRVPPLALSLLYDTFKEACSARGLLEDDREWTQCLQEASVMQTGHQLRSLFVMILRDCTPLHPEQL